MVMEVFEMPGSAHNTRIKKKRVSFQSQTSNIKKGDIYTYKMIH